MSETFEQYWAEIFADVLGAFDAGNATHAKIRSAFDKQAADAKADAEKLEADFQASRKRKLSSHVGHEPAYAHRKGEAMRRIQAKKK